MVSSLRGIIDKLEKQNDLLGKARNAFLMVESEKKHFEATLVQQSQAKSHADRVTDAHSSEKWLAFHKNLARLQAVYEFQKLKFEILNKEYLAEHLSLKLDATVMGRNE